MIEVFSTTKSRGVMQTLDIEICNIFSLNAGLSTLWIEKPIGAVVVDRTSVLGNPFILKKNGDAADRDEVIECYRKYLYEIAVNDRDPFSAALSIKELLWKRNRWINISTTVRPSRSAFMQELERIHELAKIQRVKLYCWCHPRPCHAIVIKNYLLWLEAN
jgi:hypothetical protein